MTAPVNPTPIVAYSGSLPDPSDPTTYGTRGRAVWAWETGDLFSGINLASSQAYANAVSANESAAIASATAAYKGPWSSLSGALAVPATVSHAGSVWMLISGTANVSAIQPGISEQWMNVTPITESIMSFGGFRNRVLNGDMRVAQYGNTFTNIASGISSVHVIDGWVYRNGCGAELQVSRADGIDPDGYNVKWLTVTVTSADSSISADDYSFLLNRIEGYDVSDLVGRTFTVSLLVKSSVVGVHSVEIRNSAKDRYYLGEINIATANTPQKTNIVVSGGLPSSGTWDFVSGVGIELGFVLAAGSSNTGAVGQWVSGSEIASINQVNAVGSVGNVFAIANVQLELGSAALPFERLEFSESLARCMRRYEKINFPMLQNAYNGGLGSIGAAMNWAVAKRAQPDVIIGSLAPEGGVTLVPPTFSASESGVVQSSAGTYSGAFAGNYYLLPVIADARL